MTGAFRLAGFRHVVGTLWPAQDRAATLAAVEFYKKRPAQSGTRADWATGALTRVVRQLRDTGVDTPSAWAGYVHVGP